MLQGFHVDRLTTDDEIRLVLRGELDVSVVGEVEEAIGAVASGSRVVMDVRDLSFIDSSGIRVLMTLDLRARSEGWSLAIEQPQPAVRQVLELCRIGERIPILDG
ncbi:MAG: STAS domain-containing protein [Actinomycetota bacterium]|nr:STAS domain-containing protein [Actinomycetota bacterium]